MNCDECQEPLLIVDGYLVCPRGHGKLIPLEKGMMGANQRLLRTIEVKDVREIAKELKRLGGEG